MNYTCHSRYSRRLDMIISFRCIHIQNMKCLFRSIFRMCFWLIYRLCIDFIYIFSAPRVDLCKNMQTRPLKFRWHSDLSVLCIKDMSAILFMSALFCSLDFLSRLFASNQWMLSSSFRSMFCCVFKGSISRFIFWKNHLLMIVFEM